MKLCCSVYYSLGLCLEQPHTGLDITLFFFINTMLHAGTSVQRTHQQQWQNTAALRKTCFGLTYNETVTSHHVQVCLRPSHLYSVPIYKGKMFTKHVQQFWENKPPKTSEEKVRKNIGENKPLEKKKKWRHFHAKWHLWHLSVAPLAPFRGTFGTFPWHLWHLSMAPLAPGIIIIITIIIIGIILVIKIKKPHKNNLNTKL